MEVTATPFKIQVFSPTRSILDSKHWLSILSLNKALQKHSLQAGRRAEVKRQDACCFGSALFKERDLQGMNFEWR
jgi:hypothetical protein